MENKMDEISDFIGTAIKTERVVTSNLKESEYEAAAIKQNICYIVAAVVIRGSSVLMMRESKQSCYGKWYLPAGRMERNETIEEAVKREVKEETLADVELLSLLAIDSCAFCWFRFIFMCECINDTLKTPEQEDEHSIEARWIPVDDILKGEKINLRHDDIVQHVKQGALWHERRQLFRKAQVIPVLKPHAVCILRVYLISNDEDGLHVFLGKTGNSFTEKVIRSSDGNLNKVTKFILQENSFTDTFVLHGVLSIEHTGHEFQKSDGFMIHSLAETTKSIKMDDKGDRWLLLENQKICNTVKYIIQKRLCPPVS